MYYCVLLRVLYCAYSCILCFIFFLYVLFNPSLCGDFGRLGQGQFVAGGLAVVAHEQILAGERGGVPRLAIERGELCQFDLFFWVGLEQDDVAVFRHDENVAATKQNLPVPVAAILPLAAAAPGVDAGKDAVIEPENVAVVENQIRELGLHSVRLPKFNCRKLAVFKINLKHFAAFTVA